MRPSIYWLHLQEAGRLAIMPRPRAGDWLPDEIAGWEREGINVVVSLLERHEVVELELQQEPTFCQAADIEFVPFPIPDRSVPASPIETEQLVLRYELIIIAAFSRLESVLTRVRSPPSQFTAQRWPARIWRAWSVRADPRPSRGRHLLVVLRASCMIEYFRRWRATRDEISHGRIPHLVRANRLRADRTKRTS